MNNDKYYDDILRYITDNGETGVNVLAKELSVPLSTMQRYLEKQTYFRKTVNRKWDIPDNVDKDIKSDTMTLMVDSVETSLKLLSSQLSEIQSSVQNSLMPISTLRRAVNNLSTPVADKSINMAKQLIDLNKEAGMVYDVIKKQKANIPEEYKDMLFNLDYVALVLSLGQTPANDLISGDVYALLAGKETTLLEDTIQILKDNQKES